MMKSVSTQEREAFASLPKNVIVRHPHRMALISIIAGRSLCLRGWSFSGRMIAFVGSSAIYLYHEGCRKPLLKGIPKYIRRLENCARGEETSLRMDRVIFDIDHLNFVNHLAQSVCCTSPLPGIAYLLTDLAQPFDAGLLREAHTDSLRNEGLSPLKRQRALEDLLNYFPMRPMRENVGELRKYRTWQTLLLGIAFIGAFFVWKVD